MHDIKAVVENISFYKENLGKRNFDTSCLDLLISKNDERRALINSVEVNRAEVKKLSKQIGPLKKSGEDVAELMSAVAALKKEIDSSDLKLKDVQDSINETLAVMPNVLADDVPTGTDEADNKEIKKWGEIPSFNFKPKGHHELGEELNMLDFERGAKLTGSRFVVYKSKLAKLERALINYFLDRHEDVGYEEVIPPFIVNREAMYGTGQLPKFEDDLFRLDDERDWFLIPTAEVPLTNLKKDELFQKSELPLKYASYTPCFRSEAGSYGKDTKGLIRLHQFNKVEMVNIVKSDDSEKAHEEMLNQATKLLEELKLPYRVVVLCSGDIGFGARKCFDIEVWLPGQEKYREISSISNCWDFQSRRASIRYRNDDGKPEFAHTLNGSGLAVGRTLLAIMENYQTEDGSIIVPEVLKPYMNSLDKISKV